MGVINEFDFGILQYFRMRLQPDKNQKNRKKERKDFRFYCWQHILANISGHGCVNEFGFWCFASFLDALTAR